jgi:hypothetical protein
LATISACTVARKSPSHAAMAWSGAISSASGSGWDLVLACLTLPCSDLTDRHFVLYLFKRQLRISGSIWKMTSKNRLVNEDSPFARIGG